MLVLSRKVGEEILIGDNIRVMAVAVSGNRIKLGITAPTGTPIVRSEISERVHDAERLSKPSQQHLRPASEEE